MADLTEARLKPLAIDLYAGLGGWTEGLLSHGYRVVGFDIERHIYGDHRYPAQLVIQDVRTLHGSQFKTAALIVASPPCQAYSYRAMPWKKAKALPPPDNTLFEACFRIQREAIEAAGHHIPLIVENVCGAQKWVGRARWHFGSFYLWGDVPALMPIPVKRNGAMKAGVTHRSNGATNFHGHENSRCDGVKVPTMGAGWYPPDHPKHVRGLAFNGHAERAVRRTAPGSGNRFTAREAGVDGRKVSGDWFGSYADMKAAGTISPGRMFGKGSIKRKAPSALIAKIPFVLSSHIAKAWKPEELHD